MNDDRPINFAECIADCLRCFDTLSELRSAEVRNFDQAREEKKRLLGVLDTYTRVVAQVKANIATANDKEDAALTLLAEIERKHRRITEIFTAAQEQITKDTENEDATGT